MRIKMNLNQPIWQNVMNQTARAVVAGVFTGKVQLSPKDWNYLLLEITSRPGNHWTVIDPEGRGRPGPRRIGLTASGQQIVVLCDPSLDDDIIEIGVTRDFADGEGPQ